MKRKIAILLAILILVSIFPGCAGVTEPEEPLVLQSIRFIQPLHVLPFADVQEDNWFFPYVQAVYTNRVMQGTSAETFAPHANFTRAEVVTTLFRINHGRAANESDSRESWFEDVAEEQWFAPYVAWAVIHRIDTGTSPDTFHPNRDATRQEIAMMIFNYIAAFETQIFDAYQQAGAPAGSQWHGFTDHNQITNEAYPPLMALNYWGIINGRTPTAIAPNGTAMRSEAATMLVRLMVLTGAITEPIQRPQPPTEETFQHTMGWRFSIYAEPDFRAERIATFNAQTVTVRKERPDGWALITTYLGDYWANVQVNQRFIERRTGLYAYRGAALPISAIPSQVVTILEQEETWLRISTWQGDRWIDLDFTPPIHTLDQLLGRHGNRVSVYFQNMETGFVYRYNAERTYRSASVTKAPFAMYIFEKADRDETNLNSTHRGRTQQELIRRMIMYSCNTSTFALRDLHGTTGYRQWVADLGGNPNWVAHGIMGATLTADETAIFARAIFEYIESDAPHSGLFQQYLLNNQIPFIVSDYPVASKTGWLHALLHDMAIVYADSPYILVILSDGINRGNIREISMAFQHFNSTWF